MTTPFKKIIPSILISFFSLILIFIYNQQKIVKQSNSKFASIILTFLFLQFLPVNISRAYQQIDTIGINPFSITADEKNEQLIKKSLNSIFSSHFDNKIKIIPANQITCGGSNSAFYLYSNIIILGNAVTADFNLTSCKDNSIILKKSSSGKEIGIILLTAEKFIQEVNSLSSEKNVEIPPPSETKSITSKPEIIKSEYLNGYITDISSGDIENNGKNVLIIAQKTKISILYQNGSKIDTKGEFPYDKNNTIFGSDFFKTSKGSFIFISNRNIDGRTISSYILKYDKQNLQKILTDLPFFCSTDNQGGNLFLQKNKTMFSVLDSEIERALYDGEKLITSKIHFKIPKGIIVPGITINKDKSLAAFYNSNGKISIIKPNGDIFWESSKGFGGTPFNFSTKDNYDKNLVYKKYLNPPLSFIDIDNDGEDELVAIKNNDLTSRIFSGVRNFTNGQIFIFKKGNLSFSKIFESEKIAGFISSFTINDFKGDKHLQLAYSVNPKKSSWFGGQKSFVVIQNLF